MFKSKRDPEFKYSYISAKHDKALGVFASVLADLDKVQANIDKELKQCSDIIAEAHLLICNAEKEILYLNAQKKKASETKQKIDALLK